MGTPAEQQLQQNIASLPPLNELLERVRIFHEIYSAVSPYQSTSLDLDYLGQRIVRFQWKDGGGSSATVFIDIKNNRALLTGWDRDSSFNLTDTENDQTLRDLHEILPSIFPDEAAGYTNGKTHIVSSTTAIWFIDGNWHQSAAYLEEVKNRQTDGGFTYCFSPLYGSFTLEELQAYFSDGGWEDAHDWADPDNEQPGLMNSIIERIYNHRKN